MSEYLEPTNSTAAAPRRSRLAGRRALIAVAVASLVGLAGILWILAPARSHSTDDAYVGADATTVAPRVRGFLARVLVSDNQSVHRGQPLIEIDPEEFDARIASARAAFIDAQAGLDSARAALASLDQDERLSRAQVDMARTGIRAATAQAALATADRRRYAALAETGAAPRREADSFSTAAIASSQEAARAAAQLRVAQENAGVTSARRAGLRADVRAAEAKVAQARAALDLALQDRRHAVILAPIDGVVGSLQARPGDYVQPGSRLLMLVPMNTLYATAFFKETQITHMHPGQPASIAVDALPGVKLSGRVESLAPGTGANFALLPFEPGTGNFTKIVQRVGVKIRFDPRQSDVARLRPGLSITATVRVDGR
ncbi:MULTISPECIES: HlyD family secretion protein [unclassified Sphingomonas]|uniref:HlyD family secretion protein n=1 Tax=unclassified Sphingomonas TaxID=196159 RepID=UPI00092C7620|nr:MULTISPECIES: HlyD family secretion protein [unclassified Sphingomonas]OJU17727.1 MAG: transporter [Sphingomonas sp. 66-10]